MQTPVAQPSRPSLHPPRHGFFSSSPRAACARMHRVTLAARLPTTVYGSAVSRASVYLSRSLPLSGSSPATASRYCVCPRQQQQAPVRYASTRASAHRPRNTQGSNAYRRKKSAERRERYGELHAAPADLPIQTVTDPSVRSEWNTTQGGQPRATQGLDARFPAFGRKYKPSGYDAIVAKTRRPRTAALPEFDDDEEGEEEGGKEEFQGSATIDYARPAARTPPPPPLSQSPPVGGAFGRASAYRVPGQRYGGSYQKTALYGEDDGKAREKAVEQEDEELERRWAEEDRRKEEQERKRASPTPAEPRSASPAAAPRVPFATKSSQPITQPLASPPPLAPSASSPAPSSSPKPAQTAEQQRIAALWAKQDAETAREQAAMRRKMNAPEIPRVPEPTAARPPKQQASPIPAKPYIPPPPPSGPTRTRFFEEEDPLMSPSSMQLPSRPSFEPVPQEPAPPKKIPKGGRQAKKLQEQAEREREERESMEQVEKRREEMVKAAGGEAPTGEVTAASTSGSSPSFPSLDLSTESLSAALQRMPKFVKRKPEEMQKPGAHDPEAHVPLSSVRSSSSAATPPPPLSAAICCGCGAAFQSSFLDAPGFLPEETVERFRRRRMEVYERRSEEERLKQEQAARKEENRRNRERTNVKDEVAEEREEELEVEQPVEGTIDVEATSTTAEVVSSSVATSEPSITSLSPDLHKRGKLDPTKPLSSQDLTLALNRGLLPSDDAGLLAAGVDPSSILSKKDLSSLTRAEKEAARENRGESALRCLRCFQLANYGYTRGQVSTVRAADFRTLLRSRFMERGGRSSVILKVVDISDFHGSFLQGFSDVVGGRNPIILVANKVDLLPSDYGENRLRSWIKSEAAKYGLHFHSIELVSAKTGSGLYRLSQAAAKLADPDPLHDRPRRDIYIVGCTNVGKSSIVNQMIEKRILTSKGQFEATKIRATKEGEESGDKDDSATSKSDESGPYLSASTFMSALPSTDASSGLRAASHQANPELLHQSFNVLGGKMTSSIIPGTTLGMVSFPFQAFYDKETGRKKDGVQHVMYDTPGVINEEQLSHLLTYHELREVMPRGQIQPLTYRLTRGQCLLLGGLARVDFVEGERDYCFVTVFAARTVTVHITQTEKMDEIQQAASKASASSSDPQENSAKDAASKAGQVGYVDFVSKHGGSLIYPPFTPSRCLSLGLHTGTRLLFTTHGRGWLEACSDIVFPGLGWASVTGSGQITVRGVMPGRIKAYAREPLMPFEAQKTMRKFSGSNRSKIRGSRRHILADPLNQTALKG